MRIILENRLGTELLDVGTIGGPFEGTTCELHWEPRIRGSVNGNAVGNVMKEICWNLCKNVNGNVIGNVI
jgi:hypothetical protein